MTTYFITRHTGAIEWAINKGFEGATHVAHFDPAVLEEGDVVLGILPVHLAAQVCSAGAEYWHLSMEIPAEARGKELTAEDMETFGASLMQFMVTPV